jgi:HK97 family phage major capsid protein
MNRDQLTAELNKLSNRSAELRSADASTDEILDITARINAVRSEISVIDAREATTPVVESAPVAPQSFGRSAADVLAGAPVGTSTTIDRAIVADPFGEVSTADVTYAQQTGFVAGVDAPVRFIDVLPTAVASSDAVTYVKETGFDNAAAARLAGSSTPESELSFTKVTEPIANIAHRVRVAEETLADAPALGAIIDRRGVSGVRSKLNNSLLGASNDTNGVKSVVAAATTKSYEGSLIDAILGAKSDLEALGFAPNAVVLSPANYESIVTSKTDAGAYIGAGPFSGANSTIWGLTMVVDGALAAGVDALVCDTTGATLYVRDAASVATDRDINTNLVTVRVQARAQVAVEQPEAFVKVIAG